MILLLQFRWRRIRVLIYLVIAAILVYSCTTSSSRSLEKVPPSLLPLHSETEDQSIARTTRDFPWYTIPHPLIALYNNFTTVHLTHQEREKLFEGSVKRAREVAELVLHRYVPDGAARLADVQRLVDCWTRRGRWVPGQNGYHIQKHLQDPYFGKCKNDESHRHQGYVWATPPECPLYADVDRELWCEAIGGRNILLVGDLVQYQLHEVLLDAMRDGPTVCYGELNCKDHTLCQKPESRLRYLRNDRLATNRRMNKADGHPEVGVIASPFVSSPFLRAYKIMIVTRAPVLEDDESFAQELVETMRIIRAANQDTLIIYKSASIGHPYCNDAMRTGPLDVPLDDEALRRLPYGWSELTRRNAIAKEIVQAAGGLFVDLGAMADLRPDGHVGGQDCLRYCIPGPLDAWAQVLYHTFRALDRHIPY